MSILAWSATAWPARTASRRKYSIRWADAGISVRAIAQGASERKNISVVVDGKGGAKALRAVHAAFYLSAEHLIHRVDRAGHRGRVLLAQIATQIERLARSELDIRVRGIATSKRMLLKRRRVESRWLGAKARRAGVPLDLEKFANHVQADYVPHTVMIDCTASADVCQNYVSWLTRGIHVVTPIRKPTVAPAVLPRLAGGGTRGGNTLFVRGHGGRRVAVIHTLRDLRETGDEITRIEGISRGTLAYLFNVSTAARRFPRSCVPPRPRGNTEPESPRRLVGDGRRPASSSSWAVKWADLGDGGRAGEGWCPRISRSAAWMSSWPAFRSSMPPWRDAGGRTAEKPGSALCRPDRFGRQGHRRPDPPGTPSMRSQYALTDNVVRFATRRYCNNPLIVQGPGAGPEVTAAGVFSDLLRLSAYLGAHL